MTPWWSETAGTWIGALGGTVLGTLCGLQGALAGTLAPRGRARGLVLGVHVTLTVVGVLMLLVGAAGLAVGQPHHVWFPTLWIGLLVAGVMGALLPVVRKRYRDAAAARDGGGPAEPADPVA